MKTVIQSTEFSSRNPGSNSFKNYVFYVTFLGYVQMPTKKKKKFHVKMHLKNFLNGNPHHSFYCVDFSDTNLKEVSCLYFAKPHTIGHGLASASKTMACKMKIHIRNPRIYLGFLPRIHNGILQRKKHSSGHTFWAT